MTACDHSVVCSSIKLARFSIKLNNNVVNSTARYKVTCCAAIHVCICCSNRVVCDLICLIQACLTVCIW